MFSPLLFCKPHMERNIKMNTLFIAQGAVVTGDVTLGNRVSIWYNAVLRGDMAPITIGDDSNVQECSVLHVSEDMPLSLGRGVTHLMPS